MELSISRANLEDADTIGRITSRSWHAAYRGIVPKEYLAGITPDFRAKKFREVYPLLNGVEFYLIHADNEPVGVINLHECLKGDIPYCGEIGVFYFLPDYWGKGLGDKAMSFALVRLQELGYHDAILWVLAETSRARRFYEKHGFVLDGSSKVISLGKELVEVRYRQSLIRRT